MDAQSVIERLGGTALRIGANRPFFVDDPERVHYVQHGHLDIFAVESQCGEAVGRRRFVARIGAGQMAIGAALAADAAGDMPERRLCLLAVPSQDAVVVRGARAGIDAQSFDLAATIWVDDWARQLSDFIARDLPPPRHTHLLDADPNVPVPAGAVLTARHLDVIWVRTTAPARYVGRADMRIDAGSAPLPVTERTWIETERGAAITAVYTPTALIAGDLWTALDRFGALALRMAAAADARDADALAARRRAVARSRQESSATALRALRRVLRPQEADASDGAEQQPLREAARLVAQSIGAAIEPGGRERADAAQALEAIAGRARIHVRWVTLGARWWKQAGPSMVGFAAGPAGASKPLALLSSDRGAYRAVDPSSGDSRLVDAAAAAGIGPRAAVFYAPLPEAVRGIGQVVRFALHGRWRDCRAVLFCTVLAGLAGLAAPILTGRFLVEIVPRGEASAWIAAIGALAAAALGGGAFRLAGALAMLRIQTRFDERAAGAVWGRLLSLPAPFFRNYSAGDLALRAAGTDTIRRALVAAGSMAATAAATALASLALLFYLDWPMALFVTLLLAAQSLAVWLLTLRRLRHERRGQRLAGELNGFVFQMLRGLAKLRVANAESHALNRWMRQYGAWRRERLAGQQWLAASDAFLATAQPLTLAALFASVALLLARDPDAVDLAAFLSFYAAFGQLGAGIGALTSAATALAEIVPTIERMRPILDARPEPRRGIELGDIRGDIEFDNVTFRYAAGGADAVRGISLRIRQGDYVAFAGPSGCGKSTLYRLLLGFERPAAGTVFLDGHSVSSLDMHSVRGRLGVVLQNGRVVAGSVYENIVGSSRASWDDAWAAARAAALEDDIRAMPMGMHTRLPEGGGVLSAGQKQRLLIARALALKPRVLLFDEATSALDNRSQDIVQASLKDLGITRLVIAHRLSSIRNVDRIHVLENGCIVESGSHEELMRRDGVFAALARRQLVES